MDSPSWPRPPHAAVSPHSLCVAFLTDKSRAVVHDARERSTRWVFYAQGDTRKAQPSSCLVLHNDTALTYGVQPPRETFGQHASFTAIESDKQAAALPVLLPSSSCVPFSTRGTPGMEWADAPWPEADALSRLMNCKHAKQCKDTEEGPCLRPSKACQHVPCTSSSPGSGWCRECAYFKTCRK